MKYNRENVVTVLKVKVHKCKTNVPYDCSTLIYGVIRWFWLMH